MTENLLRRVKHTLIGGDYAARQAIERFPDGELLLGQFYKPRDLRAHRRFRAMLGRVAEGTEHENATALLDWVKVGIGRFDTMLAPDGRILVQPHSSSFAAMDEAEAVAFRDQVARWISEHVLDGVDAGSVLDLPRE